MFTAAGLISDRCMLRRIEVPLRWAMMVRKPLLKWTSDLITLLGDAAHLALPFLAQKARHGCGGRLRAGARPPEHGDDPALRTSPLAPSPRSWRSGWGGPSTRRTVPAQLAR